MLPRWVVVVLLVLLALAVIAALLCLLGLRLALRRETHYAPRAAPLHLLDSGDLLFFNARAPIASALESFKRLLSKGALGTPYCHVAAVYRDTRGAFGPRDALYSFEFCLDRGGPVLFPLRRRAHRSMGRLLSCELSAPRPEIDRDALDAFVLESSEATRAGRSTKGVGAWSRSMLKRHVLFMCPNPRDGGTCADHVLRFMDAAGLWSAEERCFCTSVTDLLASPSGAGLPPFDTPEVVKRIKGCSSRHRSLTRHLAPPSAQVA
jgi:hypothetical protein